jgi:hypothetical protein
MKSQTSRPAMRAPPTKQPTAAPAITPVFDGPGMGDGVAPPVELGCVDELDCWDAEACVFVEVLDALVVAELVAGICKRKIGTKVSGWLSVVSTVAFI